jgi:hypothetical protein
MANHALFVGWNVPVRGREKEASMLFQRSLEYYGQLQAKGTIESFEPVVLGRHGGDMNGYVLLRGDQNKLDKLRHEPDFIDLVLECGNLVDGFGVTEAYINDGLADIMMRWNKSISR